MLFKSKGDDVYLFLMALVFQNLALILLYIAASYVAWAMAIPPFYASVFWPAAGIALGFVYLYGKRVLPGVFLGAIATVFLSPLGNEANVEGITVALGIAFGASLQAYIGSYFIKKAIGENTNFQALNSIIVFNAIGVLSALVASSVATLVFYSVGRIEGSAAFSFWESWCIGDALGIFIAAPLTVLGFSKGNISRRRRTIVIVPVFILFCIVGFVFFNLKADNVQTRQESFENNVELIHREISEKFEFYLSDINALQSFFKASAYVDREEFSRFVSYVLEKDSGIRGFGWSPYITQSNKQEFLVRARQEYSPSFDILEITPDGLKPGHKSDVYMPLYYAEPYPALKDIIGTDLWSHNTRRDALKAALENNVPQASGPLTLVNEEGESSPGFILAAPVYKVDGVRDPLSYKGIVNGAFQYSSVAETATSAWRNHGIELVMRASNGTSMAEVYSSENEVDEADFIDSFVIEIPFVFAGQSWSFQFYMNPEFYNQNINYSIWYALIAGLVFLAFTCAFLMVLTFGSIDWASFSLINEIGTPFF